MFEVTKFPESDRVEKMSRKFGNSKKLDVTFFQANTTVYIHINDLRKGKSVTLSQHEWQEIVDFQNTLTYAIGVVEGDGLAEVQNQAQHQQQQMQQNQQVYHQLIYSPQLVEGPSAPAPAKKSKKN